MTLFISNPSRGGATPSTSGDPSEVRVSSPVQVSLRDTSTAIDITQVQVGIGYAKVHGLGAGGPFEGRLPRTKLGSILTPQSFSPNVSMAVVGSELQITRASTLPGASAYFTSVDRGNSTNMNAMLTSVLHIVANPPVAGGDPDPLGPILGIEHGPKNTAAYCIFLDNGTQKQIRICGPKIGNTRAPDLYFNFDWSATAERRYILFCNEVTQRFELWSDDTTGSGGIGIASLIATVPLSDFQQFSAEIGNQVRMGGANDITGVYGTEAGSGPVTVGVVNVGIGADAGFPFVNGALSGGWKSYLDSDASVGFSGAVDPTRLSRGGAWFVTATDQDLSGQLMPSTGGFCRFIKATASKNFSIFREEPGFLKTATDGIALEFKCSTSTLGSDGSATSAAIQIEDGTSLFQIDFFFDGSTYNLGLLREGGDPSSPSDHLLASSPIDYRFKTLKLTIDPRRSVIDLFDVDDLTTPLATWQFTRSSFPASTATRITVGLPVTSTTVVGTFDVYSLRYSYIYQAWESNDSVAPTVANPPFTASATGSSSLGNGTLQSDGYRIDCTGGQTLLLKRGITSDLNRGGVVEACLKITSWHPEARTGSFIVLDDSTNAFMLSFIETDSGKFVCIPLAAGLNSFQEYAGKAGLSAQLSIPIDWTNFHTYRLERRPRDGVFLYIDGSSIPALYLPDSARYSYPTTQFNSSTLAFGQYTDEGVSATWKFVRACLGSGYELSTILNVAESELEQRLTGAQTMVVVAAGA